MDGRVSGHEDGWKEKCEWVGEWGIEGKMSGYMDETGMGRWVHMGYKWGLTE